jgi:hypothetical protein
MLAGSSRPVTRVRLAFSKQHRDLDASVFVSLMKIDRRSCVEGAGIEDDRAVGSVGDVSVARQGNMHVSP